MYSYMDLAKKVLGTSLMGHVRTTYDRIVQEFGEPNLKGDSYKVDAEWVIDTPFGVATIYNYKDGHAYLGEKGLDVKDITDWHIGGHNRQVVAWIARRINSSFNEFEVRVESPWGWEIEYYKSPSEVTNRILDLEEEARDYKVYAKRRNGRWYKVNWTMSKWS